MNRILALFPVGVAATMVTSLCAQSWNLTSAPNKYWWSVASSADGIRLIAAARGGTSPYAGPIYTSTNSGVTWLSNNLSPRTWACVASSADGSTLAAADGYTAGSIYLSTNAGITWAVSGAPGASWSSVATSTDGTKLLATTAYGAVYTSSDSGTTWASNSFPVANARAAASSADGTKLAEATISGGAIFSSANSGMAWTSNHIGARFADFPCLASSADGSQLAVGIGGNGGLIYTSTDAGATWASNSVPHDVWSSIAMSADGSTIIAGGYYWIYASTNSGATWVSNDVPSLTWQSVASSADGCKLVAVVFGGGIYTWQSPPRPQLHLSLSDTNLALSWLVPSTDFLLQQTADMSPPNWGTLTNTLLLNLMNLDNKIILPPLGDRACHRLLSQ